MLFAEYEPLILLLRTLSDFDFQPKTWTGSIVQRQAKAGEGPSERISCAACDGEGRRRVRGIPTQCETCTGRGWIVVDSYTRRAIGTAETELVDRRRWVRCDSCGGPHPGRAPGMHGNGQECRCADSGRPGYVLAPERPVRPWRGESQLRADAPELGPDDPVIAALEAGMPGVGKAYERRVLEGDYEQLGLALACLRLDRPPLYRLVVGIYVEAEREPEQLHVDEALAMGVGLHYVRALMPEAIRVPSWAARYEKRRRERVESNGKEVAA